MAYAELHCKTNFSFLEGASFPDELVKRAAELRLAALAVTDRNTLAGVVRAHTAAKELGLKLLIGAELTPTDSPPLLLYARNRRGYGVLARLLTVGCRRGKKGECILKAADVAAHSQDLLAAVVPPAELHRLEDWRHTPAPWLQLYKEAFGKQLYAAAELHLDGQDVEKLALLRDISQQHDLPLFAANDVHYHESSRRFLQDVLVCVREGCAIAQAGYRLFANAERRLKSPEEMAHLWGVDNAVLLARTLELAQACSFSLDELRYEYPQELAPDGQTPLQYLSQLTWAGAAERWPQGIPDKVRAQLEHELTLIAELHYEAYFLTVWDLVRFARARNILCQGRGSAANSAVCFCIGITAVDPARSDVLFERFISRERAEAPDIDVDFEHERREEVMQYVYQKYGRERAGIVAEVISYRPKSAVRDVGKALGLSLDRVDLLAGVMERYGDSSQLPESIREAGLDPEEPTMKHLRHLVRQILGFPRHLSQHVGGFVITRGPLCELVPIGNAAMPERTFIEWDKDDIDALGILKVDCLALGMLTALHKCLDLVNTAPASAAASAGAETPVRAETGRPELTLATIPAEDPAVYEMCCKADTIGVFQIESRAQMSMLPRLKPRSFYDLVIEVSIVRPGPIQGGMVHPFLRRRAGEEVPSYPNAAVRQVLEKTLGVPLFQEQVMRLAVVAAGFTPGEADQLRRAMGAWRRPGLVEQLREKMLSGMLKNGLPREYAEQIFEQIRGFGEYGFPESHAASFALLVYASAWLKLHYPAQFTTALLNSQPMGFYAPAQLIRDAQAHGVQMRPIDVNFSHWDCVLEEPDTIRLGFRLVRGLSYERQVAPLLAARAAEPFTSLVTFARRTELSKSSLARLAAADAFGSLHVDRRAALWQVLALAEELPLFKAIDAEEPEPALAQMPLPEQVRDDYQTTGLSLKAHPMSLVRSELDKARVRPCAALGDLKDGAFARVAGLVLVRQRPDTASGVIFMTLEDESGNANLVVWPKIYERFRKVARLATALIVEGKVQRKDDLIHVVVSRFKDVAELLPEVRSQSRDFH